MARNMICLGALAALALLGTASSSPAAPAPPAVLAREYAKPFRVDMIDIPIAAAGSDGSELEYKVHMIPGQTLVYSWTVTAPKGQFYVDFHSEQKPSPKEHEISHKAGFSLGANGALVAPFEGVHGWYFQNQSAKPVVVHLKISGFYDLLPGGKPPG